MLKIKEMDKKLVGLFSLFFIVFTFFSILVLARDPISRSIRATEDKQPSSASSILLAWPLSVKMNQQSTITVFVRSVSGKPLPGRNVTLSTSLGSIREPNLVSDEAGRAETLLLCNQVGVAQLGAVIDGNTPINQKITVECK